MENFSKCYENFFQIVWKNLKKNTENSKFFGKFYKFAWIIFLNLKIFLENFSKMSQNFMNSKF
jgi:hypothetical protein